MFEFYKRLQKKVFWGFWCQAKTNLDHNSLLNFFRLLFRKVFLIPGPLGNKLSFFCPPQGLFFIIEATRHTLQDPIFRIFFLNPPG